MIRRAFLPTFFDIYQLLVAAVGMAGVNYVLLSYSLSMSLFYAVVTVSAYWLGQGLVSLLKTPRRSLD